MNVLDIGAEPLLERIDSRLDEYKILAEQVATLEAAFKSWEASCRIAHMDSGESATKAETMVRSTDEWRDKFEELESARIAAENIKSRVHQGIRYFEAWRSKYSAEKRVT